MSNHVLELQIIGEDHNGEICLLSCITLSPSITGLDLAIKLNRQQFPIQLTFAITINKSQGQTLNHIAIDLCKYVFTHGQLYVTFSQSTSSHHVKVLLHENSMQKQTPNIIYNKILL